MMHRAGSINWTILRTSLTDSSTARGKLFVSKDLWCQPRRSCAIQHVPTRPAKSGRWRIQPENCSSAARACCYFPLPTSSYNTQVWNTQKQSSLKHARSPQLLLKCSAHAFRRWPAPEKQACPVAPPRKRRVGDARRADVV